MIKKTVGLLLISSIFTIGCSGTRKVAGHNMGKLAPCPSSPNCVSSQSIEGKQKIDPIAFEGDAAAAETSLLGVLNSMKRVSIITCEDGYIHAEFTTALFRFVDDVEFYIDRQANVIHFRSASRKGYSDMGVNRKRMEEIQRRFEQK